jgi:hypothetical protein
MAMILAGISILIFVLALPWNAFCATYGGLHCYAGGEAAFEGLFGLLTFEPGNWCWGANPLALLTVCIIVLHLRKPGTALACGAIALVVALAFPLGHVSDFQFITDNPGQNQHMPIVTLGLAYWLWLGSIACACAAALLNRLRSVR